MGSPRSNHQPPGFFGSSFLHGSSRRFGAKRWANVREISVLKMCKAYFAFFWRQSPFKMAEKCVFWECGNFQRRFFPKLSPAESLYSWFLKRFFVTESPVNSLCPKFREHFFEDESPVETLRLIIFPACFGEPIAGQNSVCTFAKRVSGDNPRSKWPKKVHFGKCPPPLSVLASLGGLS